MKNTLEDVENEEAQLKNSNSLKNSRRPWHFSLGNSYRMKNSFQIFKQFT